MQEKARKATLKRYLGYLLTDHFLIYSGFWFEMKDSVRGPSAILQNMDGSFVYSGYKPKEAPLTLFQGNVAHSNYEHGIKTYPGTGYKPIGDPAVFLDTKSFRNSGKGVFIHNSYNIKIVGGLVSRKSYIIFEDMSNEKRLSNHLF